MNNSGMKSSSSSNTLRNPNEPLKTSLPLVNHRSNPFLDTMSTGSGVSYSAEPGLITQSNGTMKSANSRSRIVDINTIKAVIETTDNDIGKPSDCDSSIAGSRKKSFLTLGLMPRNSSHASVGSKTSELSGSSSHSSKNFYDGGMSRIISSSSSIANSIISAPTKLMQSKEANHSTNEESIDNSNSNLLSKTRRNISIPKISSKADANARREKYLFEVQSASIMEGNEVTSNSLMGSISNMRTTSNSSMKNIAVIMNAANNALGKPNVADDVNMCSSLHFMKYLERTTCKEDVFNFDEESDPEPESPQSIDKKVIGYEDPDFSFVDAVQLSKNVTNSKSPKTIDEIKKMSGKRRGLAKSSSVSSIDLLDESANKNGKSRTRSSTAHLRQKQKK
jgi:hypothetical protein